MLIGKMRTAADVLGLYLNLYAPRKLNPIDRIKFLELESQTGLPNGTMASILASGGKPKKSWILYKDAVTSTVKRLNPALSLPFWNNDKLSGKKIVFRREPGPSDEILYASIFNEVIADGCEVIIEADKRLTPLFARSFPKAEVVPRLENSPHPRLLQKDIDFQANFSDPFGNYRDHISKFPDHGGYLIPNPEKVLFWKKYLNKYSDFPRIGISWGSEGSPIWTTQLSQWEYILTQSNVHFFNLEYSDATEDLTWASEKLGANIHTPEGLDLYNDLEGLAALISNLDLIITISNVNSLLGGALNIPTWVICPNFWYYLFDTDIYHFFPRSRVFTWVGNNNPKTALDDAGKDLNKILRESDHSGKRSDSFQNLAFRQIDN